MKPQPLLTGHPSSSWQHPFCSALHRVLKKQLKEQGAGQLTLAHMGPHPPSFPGESPPGRQRVTPKTPVTKSFPGEQWAWGSRDGQLLRLGDPRSVGSEGPAVHGSCSVPEVERGWDKVRPLGLGWSCLFRLSLTRRDPHPSFTPYLHH